MEIVDSDYTPSKAEMNEEFQIDRTPEELAKALFTPVRVRTIKKPRKRR